jgi:hypothetical protein
MLFTIFRFFFTFSQKPAAKRIRHLLRLAGSGLTVKKVSFSILLNPESGTIEP